MRKSVFVTIDDEGRDKGKTYVIKEMPARAAEKWASRALIAISRGAAGAVTTEIDANSGWAGLAAVGLGALGGIRWDEADPLMDEMMTCVRIVPDPTKDFSRPLMEDDIEEVATLVVLRTRALELHGNFSFAAVLSRLKSMAQTAAAVSKSTSTSPAP